MNRQSISEHLLGLYKGVKERVGFVMNDGSIVEVHNIAPDPDKGFLVDADDVIAYGDDAIGTWHTHPGATANLSAGDRETFLSWPGLIHFIVGRDGVRLYEVKNREVLCIGGSISTGT